MGHRANLILLSNGNWRLYYCHGCAHHLDIDLFWGPDLAVEFIEQCQDRASWLDEVWCEGAALIDLDRRVLLFFSCADTLHDLPLRRAHLVLMAENWPGWDIRWANSGILSIAEYLHLDKSQFIKVLDIEDDSKFWFNSNLKYNKILLTIAKDRTVTALQIDGEIDYLELGLATLDNVIGVSNGNSLVWEGGFPSGGVHVDFDSKILNYWVVDIWSRYDRVTAAWDGWRVQCFSDQFEKHLALVSESVRLAYPSDADIQQTIFAYLHANITSYSGSSEAKKLAILERISQRLAQNANM